MNDATGALNERLTPPTDEEIRQAGTNLITAARELFDKEITESSLPPDELEYYKNQPEKQDFYERMVNNREKAEEDANTAIEELSSLIEQYITLFSLDASQQIISDIEGVRTILGSARADLTDVQAKLGDWRGTAALSFNDNFLSPMDEAVDHQRELLAAIKIIVESYRELVACARIDLVTICEGTTEVLRSASNDSAISFTEVLTVVTSVISLLSAVSGGATLPLVTSAIGFTKAVASVEVDVSFGSAESILAEFREAVSQLIISVTDVDNALGHAMNDTAADVRTDLNTPGSVYYVPMRPMITDGGGVPEEFTPPKTALPPEAVSDLPVSDPPEQPGDGTGGADYPPVP